MAATIAVAALWTITAAVAIAAGNNSGRHKVSQYIRKVISTAATGTMPHKTKGGIKGGAQRMAVFVRTTDDGVLSHYGCHVLASFGDTHIVSIPLDSIDAMAASSSVERIEAGPSSTTLLDTTAIVTHADIAHYSYPWTETVNDSGASAVVHQGFTGAGVVMGLMDIGFDLTHPTFYSADGSRYRIKALWDQLDRTGQGMPVTGTDTVYVGRQYTTQEALLSKGCSYDGNAHTHGTYTASIAAGSGWHGDGDMPNTLRYCGMAPDADLCLVANMAGDNIDSVPSELRTLYTSATDALGFKYIFDYADAHQQPCIISFSEGGREALYSDDALYCKTVTSMLGPGHILCVAAGNEAIYNAHISKPLGTAEAGAFIKDVSSTPAFYITSQQPARLRVTFYPENAERIIREYSMADLALLPDSALNDTIHIEEREQVVILRAYKSYFDNDDRWAMETIIADSEGLIVGRSIPVSLTLLGEDVAAELTSLGGQLTTNDLDPALSQMDNTHNIFAPATFPGVICVGSTTVRNDIQTYDGKWHHIEKGEIGHQSNFSSMGPTLMGYTKPDIMAPGASIFAAASSYYLEHLYDDWNVMEYYTHEGRRYGSLSDNGTSASSPAVGGIIALWLQACPTLTPQQVMETFAATATHPEPDLPYPNNRYGYGQIDAVAGLDYIRAHFADGIKLITTDTAHPYPTATYNICGQRVGTAYRGIIITNGRKVMR